jgi:multiphosphoryl transfer protein
MDVGEFVALLAPLSGQIVPIESVPDPVFADKILGDGISIDPTSQVLLAPCDATVDQLHEAHHAISLRTPGGVGILMHIGLETYQLKGKCFKTRVRKGDKVTTGQPLIEFDADFLICNAHSLLTQVIITNGKFAPIVERAGGLAQAGVSRIMSVRRQRALVKAEPQAA